MKLPLRFVLPAFLIIGLTALSAAGDPPDARLARLERQIQAYIRAIPGPVGVAIKHVESGQQVLIRGDESFPMASTFKVAVLLEVFAQEKKGRLSLDDEVVLDRKDQHMGSGSLRDYRLPGVKLSIANLCELMMTVSDNSATDLLLERVGKDRVNARLKAIGVEGLRVDRSCQDLIGDYLREPKQYYDDGQDSSTPAAMNKLLEKVFTAEALDRDRCDQMLDIMKRCHIGEARLPALLPPRTVLAHKTGTVGTAVNDVGIIYLPDSAGHVIISVFTKDPANDSEMYDRYRAERIIAQIGRAAYDYFLFTAPAAASP
jgi:beta-lactamase class A